MIPTWIRRQLKRSPPLVNAKRVLWTASRRALRRCDTRIVEGLSIFAPSSSGPLKDRARLAIQGANQTFPLIVDLLSISGRPIEATIPIEAFGDSETKMAAAARLKVLFDKFGSDKATTNNYHLFYGSILAEPDSMTDLLEIGIGTNNPDVVSNMGMEGRPGASLRAFREFLPQARIYGADVDRRSLFEEERIRTFFVDQTEPDSFDQISAAITHEVDLIIDDGLHAPNANIATLAFALSKLKIGGWLVVEDITPHALPVWRVVSALLPRKYKSHIVAARAALLFAVQRHE